MIGIKKQEFNGKKDSNGKSLYEVVLEGDVHLRPFGEEILNRNGTYSISGALEIPGNKEKQYDMTIKDHKVVSVSLINSWA